LLFEPSLIDAAAAAPATAAAPRPSLSLRLLAAALASDLFSLLSFIAASLDNLSFSLSLAGLALSPLALAIVSSDLNITIIFFPIFMHGPDRPVVG
jgi:hypothetical protein